MALVCEDLARYGVVLVPPSAAEHLKLWRDIECRLQARPKGSPPSGISEHDTSGSVILLNHAPVAIASIAYIWSFRGRNDRIEPHCFSPGKNPSVLLPFGLNDSSRKFTAFWDTIFPGSKCLMTADRYLLRDNTDVRAPAEDELSHGGFFSMGSGFSSDGINPVRLTLDGVFFVDGGFAGQNQLAAWEQTVFAAEAYLACAALAREAHGDTRPASHFFDRALQLTGQANQERMPVPPPPISLGGSPRDPEPIRKCEQQWVGWKICKMRESMGDEKAMAEIEAWGDAPIPRFYKL